jgi:hypothetical protein
MAPNRGAASRRLSQPQVIELRDLYRDGMSYWDLHVRYGLSTGTIHDIVNGITYAWVPGAADARAKMRGVRTAQEERRAYIIANWRDRSDEEMADYLDVSLSAVKNVRLRLDLIRMKAQPARLRMMAAE